MRVAYLTAGAGGMYCGSCLRDNTLVAALIRQRRDVVLIPLYTPTRTDEENVSEDCVLFGGINVYLQHKSAVFRHLPDAVSSALDSPRLLRFLSRVSGMPTPARLGPLTVSTLQGAGGPQRRAVARLIRAVEEIRPDVVHLPNLLLIGLASELRRQLRIPVVCALAGEDVFTDKLPEPYYSQVLRLIQAAADEVDAFIAPTKYYAQHAIEHFNLPADRVHVVPLGIRLDDIPPHEPRGLLPQQASAARAGDDTDGDRPFTIGYLARVSPDKGLHVLSEAFAILRREGRKCRLAAAGYLPTADRSYLADIQRDLAKHGFSNGFEYAGELSRPDKFRFLKTLDAFSVPTTYRESKGLYILEAMSQGVPVVQPCHGSFPELIDATGGGVVLDPVDSQALAEKLGELMDDPALRATLGGNAAEAVRQSFTDERMAEATWRLFRKLAKGDGASP
ncbi:MAG: glycosyltransferase family 4 protein [Planctomycetota bacterium]